MKKENTREVRYKHLQKKKRVSEWDSKWEDQEKKKWSVSKDVIKDTDKNAV